VFGRLHPRGQFPHISLLVVGGLAMLASLLTLEWVISALLTARILVQFAGQILALHVIRSRRAEFHLPFRMWLYPLPSLLALLGWLYVFLTAGGTFILYGLLTLAAGVGAWWLWSRKAQAAVD
jgi:amino acid transporter